jgi:hypothetical protein
MHADHRRTALVAGGAVTAVVLIAPPAEAQVSPCEMLPGAARLACEGARGLTGGVGGAVGGAVTSVADSAINGAASAFAEAGGYFMGKVAELLGATTEVDLGAEWFTKRYALMFGISALLTFALLLLAVTKAVVRGQGLEALRSGTAYYLAAVIASAFAPAFVYLLVQLSDAVSIALTFGAADDSKAFLTDTGRALTLLSVGNPAAGAATLLVTSFFAILCSVILWIELLLRTAIIYVATLFAAPTFSGLVDRALWKHARRWVYFTVSVVFAKPVVVAVLSLAAAGAGNAGTADGFSSVFVALALMVVAIFCVGLLFRLIPNAGDELAGALSARRELNSSTPHSPVPGPGVVVRQSVQSHLVRAASGAGSRRVAMAGAGAAAGPAVALTAAGAAAHRTAGHVTQGVGSAVRSATSSVPPAPTREGPRP